MTNDNNNSQVAGTLLITVEIKASQGQDIMGIKESLSMFCEQFGDTKIVNVRNELPKEPEQLKL